MIWRSLKLALIALAALLQFQGHAEDIDIFAYSSTSGGANVLFVIDNAANFSASETSQRCSITAPTSTSSGVVVTDGSGTAPTQLDRTAAAVEQCALYSALQSIEAGAQGSFNVGFMVFNANGMQSFNPASGSGSYSSSCVGSTGGCLVVPFTPFTSTSKANILAWIRGWRIAGNVPQNIKGTNSANGAVMQEAWAYFTGRTGVSGRSYASIKPAVTCGGNYVLFIGNSVRNNATPGDGTNAANSPKTRLEGTSGTSLSNANPAATSDETAVITGPLPPVTQCGAATLQTAEGRGIYALNWAKYMRQKHQITTTSIGVFGPSCNAEYATHLSMLGEPAVGGGGFYGGDTLDELRLGISTALSNILVTNSTFASVSLPVSVNTQGLFLNQVFIGMFRPDKEFMPRWRGNLKQYKMGYVSPTDPTLVGLDAKDAPTTNALTGFIAPCAVSFWNRSTPDTYWTNDADAAGSCTSLDTYTESELKWSNYPDGQVVEKGGQAFRLRQTTVNASNPGSTRNVRTCFPASTCVSSTALASFSTANTAITQASLDPTSASNRNELINWIRGANVKTGENELGLGTLAMRPSVHGDVVHSRPVAVNHGTTNESPNIVVYYGANDGMLRAVNGNRSNSASFVTPTGMTTFAAGDEIWSFMPPEFYGRIKRLYDNTKAIFFPGTPVAGSTRATHGKEYGMDGPVTAFQDPPTASPRRTYIYATMRRGGRLVYAFDVSSPGSPSLLWRHGCPNLGNDTGCTTDANGVSYSGIGQTWAPAKAVKIAGVTNPVLLMGGGYDDCEDTDNGTNNHGCTGSSKGRKIYVLDATNGTILKAFDTVRPVVSEPTVVNDADGRARYAYVADLGGNVYRLTFPVEAADPGLGDPKAWTITRIASLGCDTVTPSVYTPYTAALGTGTTGVGYGAATSSCAAPRKFMFSPSVITTDSITYSIYIGSGDREKPVAAFTATQNVANRFFHIKDRPASSTWLSDESGTCSSTAVICRNSLYAIGSSTPTETQLATKPKGWTFGLDAGEQVVTSALTIFGITNFSTNKPAAPSSTSCAASLGDSRVYRVSYLDAAPVSGNSRYQDLAGDGLPPSPVAGRVFIEKPGTNTLEPVPFCIGCSPESPLASVAPQQLKTVTRPKTRLYWYMEK